MSARQSCSLSCTSMALYPGSRVFWGTGKQERKTFRSAGASTACRRLLAANGEYGGERFRADVA